MKATSRGIFTVMGAVLLGGALSATAFFLGKKVGHVQCRSAETMPLMAVIRQVQNDLSKDKVSLALKRMALIDELMKKSESRSPESFYHQVMSLNE